MKLLLIGIGGGLGSIARFYLGEYIKNKIDIDFPVSMMIINILGSFLLGISFANTKDINYIFFIQSGFLGGFTSFSTFILQAFNLSKSSKVFKSILYLSASIFFGLIAFLIAFNINF